MSAGIDRVSDYLVNEVLAPLVTKTLDDPEVQAKLSKTAGDAAAEAASRPEVTALVMSVVGGLVLLALLVRR